MQEKEEEKVHCTEQRERKKSRKTLNLSTDADSITIAMKRKKYNGVFFFGIFFYGGGMGGEVSVWGGGPMRGLELIM